MIGKVGYSYSHELLKHIEKVGDTKNEGGCPMDFRELTTDVLIIGGGTAGCYAAITLGQEKDIQVLIVEKANIKRSGCLAAGVNAINAYITEGCKKWHLILRKNIKSFIYPRIRHRL